MTRTWLIRSCAVAQTPTPRDRRWRRLAWDARLPSSGVRPNAEASPLVVGSSLNAMSGALTTASLTDACVGDEADETTGTPGTKGGSRAAPASTTRRTATRLAMASSRSWTMAATATDGSFAPSSATNESGDTTMRPGGIGMVEAVNPLLDALHAEGLVDAPRGPRMAANRADGVDEAHLGEDVGGDVEQSGGGKMLPPAVVGAAGVVDDDAAKRGEQPEGAERAVRRQGGRPGGGERPGSGVPGATAPRPPSAAPPPAPPSNAPAATPLRPSRTTSRSAGRQGVTPPA